MEDEASTSLDGKGLGNLRVIDLKQELEKRGLSKSGSKKDLVKRLKQQLEFEKLCEERKTSGGLISVTEEGKNINSCDFDRKLELDAAIEQNEFVQQYLAQQQKRYAERKEAEKRLEMEALEKQKEDPELDSGVTADDKDEEASDTDDESADGPSTHVDEPSKTEQKENIDKGDKSTSEVLSSDKRPLNSGTEDEEPSCPSPPSEPEGERVEQRSPQPNDVKVPAKMKENVSVVVDINENVEIIRNISPPSSPESEVGESRTLEISEPVSEGKDENENISVPVVPDNVREQTDCTVSDSVKYSGKNKNPESLRRDVSDSKDSEISQNPAQDVAEPQSSVAAGSEESSRCDSSSEPVGEISRSENLFKQDSLASMEPSECSPVPYSLSDIQLPESPGHHLKCKELNEEKSNKTDSSPEPTVDKVKSNGVAIDNTLNSSNEKEVSDSESRENNSPEKSEKSPEKSPEKPCQKNESESNQQTGESSDVDSDKNNSKLKTKCLANDDTSSNIDNDSVENAPKDNVSKEQKSLKRPQQLDESDDGKSSDSEKYKSSRLDSRHKSHGKLRKRNRHSRSRSSSSSSSHSSDSSPKRRHSKKSVVNIKSKNYVENDESNQMSEKSSDDKPDKLKNEDSLLESSSLSSKRRLKIKRDNVPLEINAASLESVESVSSRSLDNVTCSMSQSVSEKPPKQESTEARLSFSELSYVPRKVSLSNRKLNRKSSEEKNNEPKSKRNKWESFAAAQKTSQTISISTDSLKTWFPDFKLMSEPASSMELEPDEHSLPAADEKNDNFTNIDVSNINDNGMKQESTLQMVIEDSESREPDFEDSAEQGPVSKILFIQNLVRPFTLNQLKDLLKQSGKIVEEYFWIDKIKSKCFVMYETEKEAIKARNTLNNTRWPSSNPKILSVEYSNEEEMEQHKKGNEPPPKPVIEPPVAPEIPEVIEARISHPIDDHKRKDRERRKEREKSKPLPPVREWDKDKVMQESPEREPMPKEEKSRSSDKKEKKESKKRPNEDTPAKLLDDLFQKTKNPPCIYWLPLTEEQAKQKEEAKKMRKLEREKRNQQLKEQEEAERRNKRARSSRRSREKENRKSSTRSRSPVTRRR